MTNLAKAPLIYTIGVTRFPRLPDQKAFEVGFHQAIRSEYPIVDSIDAPMVSASFGPDGFQIQHQETRLLQYASADRQWAFIFTDEILALHTAAYFDHASFIERFRVGLEALLGVPGIGILWLEAVGIRYVDLVVPRDGERLNQYLKPWVLPNDMPVTSGVVSLTEGMYVATYKTNVGEMRFQALRNPPTTLPPELDSPLVQRNGWKRNVPSTGEFAVLDVDHGNRFEVPVRMDSTFVCEQILELRSVAKEMFESAGTDFAKKVWEGTA